MNNKPENNQQPEIISYDTGGQCKGYLKGVTRGGSSKGGIQSPSGLSETI